MLLPAHSEAAFTPGRQPRKSSLEIFLVVVVEVAVGHQHLELKIKYQERLQQVVRSPKPRLSHGKTNQKSKRVRRRQSQLQFCFCRTRISRWASL